MIAQIIGGSNTRIDFHNDSVQEFFYQIKGDMILKVIDDGEIKSIRLNEGEVFMLPPHMRHSPQRPVPGSYGLVVESPRMAGMLDAIRMVLLRVHGQHPPHRGAGEQHRRRPAAALRGVLRRRRGPHLRRLRRGASRQGKASAGMGRYLIANHRKPATYSLEQSL